jgi:SAM-dependent methyltransferase
MTTQEQELDVAAIENFAMRVGGAYVEGMTVAMIAIGHQVGLFDAAAQGRATSAELAARAGLHERYVREWLGAVTTAGIFRYDPASDTYELPIEHAFVLTGDGASNMATQAKLVTYLCTFIDPVAEHFRAGGGLSYDHYRPGFTSVMDQINRRLYNEALVSTYVPFAEGLSERLTTGASVADIGTGAGHPLNLLAQAFPNSSFVGFDIAPDALGAGTTEAAELSLGNVKFVQRDVAHLDEVAAFDVITAFDSIHDQADPAGVLRGIRTAVKDDGVFLMVDIKASSHLEDNCANPIAPLLYGVSVLHCMTVSLAYDGAGLGTVWGEQVACEMLREAGFSRVEVHEIPQDPFNVVYVCRP